MTSRYSAPSDRESVSDRERAVVLAACSVVAMVAAYVLAFSVLNDTDMASKFENGVAPAGADIAGNRIAVVGSLVAAATSVATVMIANIRCSTVLTKLIAVLDFLALTLFALISLLTIGLAF